MNIPFLGYASTEVTTKDGSETEFHISVVHGPENAGLAVLLTSVKWPDYVVAMDDHTSSQGTGTGKHRTTQEYSLDAQKLLRTMEVEDAASLLYIPPVDNPRPNATMVMIKGIDDEVFAYSRKLSYGIHGDDEDQGAGMYWYIEPPLPEKLTESMHAYIGERCQFDCGDPLISGAVGRGWLFIQGVITISMLFVGPPWTVEV